LGGKLAKVICSLQGTSIFTNVNISGDFSFSVPSYSQVKLLASYPGLIFSPDSLFINIINENINNVDFYPIQQTYSISGVVKDQNNLYYKDIDIILTSLGNKNILKTDSNGYFIFDNLDTDDYNIEVLDNKYNFITNKYFVSISNQNITNILFKIKTVNNGISFDKINLIDNNYTLNISFYNSEKLSNLKIELYSLEGKLIQNVFAGIPNKGLNIFHIVTDSNKINKKISSGLYILNFKKLKGNSVENIKKIIAIIR